jgi:hypothetical protein
VSNHVSPAQIESREIVKKLQKMRSHHAYHSRVGSCLSVWRSRQLKIGQKYLGIRDLEQSWIFFLLVSFSPGSSQPAEDDDIVVPVMEKLVFHPDQPVLLTVLQIPVSQNKSQP